MCIDCRALDTGSIEKPSVLLIGRTEPSDCRKTDRVQPAPLAEDESITAATFLKPSINQHWPLCPPIAYEFAQWKKVTVNIDYHVDVEQHYYSVPYQLKGKKLEVSITATTIAVFHKNRSRGQPPEKSPQVWFYHRGRTHAQSPIKSTWNGPRHGSSTGPGKRDRSTQQLVTDRSCSERSHPEQGFRSCLGVMRLAKRYTPQRLEKACERAVAIGAYAYKNVGSILKNGLDQQPLTSCG